MPCVMSSFKNMIKLCKKNNFLSLIDGAQAIGMVYLKFLMSYNPLFLATNLHKCMSVPKYYAMLSVNLKDHHIIQTNTIS